jgi:hypothetical protein
MTRTAGKRVGSVFDIAVPGMSEDIAAGDVFYYRLLSVIFLPAPDTDRL